MAAQPALRIHLGHTVHRRFKPFRSSFRYRVAMIDLDVDRLDEASRQTKLFAVERPALFSFRRRDHAAQVSGPLRPWAEAQFQTAGINPPEGALRLITFPRHAFYKFAPISLWLAFDISGDLTAILYEVRNTFGERHTYAARLNGSWSRHDAAKSFHVSPFMDVSGQYRFSLQYGQDDLRLGVTTIKDGRPFHIASLTTHIRTATDAALASVAVRLPLSTIGVSLAIHWEALKLWLRGARYHSKPKNLSDAPTRATVAEWKQ